jgi:hypothetical protein
MILEDFYSIDAEFWAREYATKGEISVPCLNPNALSKLGEYAQSVEHLGKARYGMDRPCYPPGEVALNFAESDPRKDIFTGVNLTAISQGHMTKAAEAAANATTTGDNYVSSSPVQWIYHSPHLREFLRVVMGSQSLHPYMSDLGVAVNVMRPRSSSGGAAVKLENESKNDKTALGFHFDSINSSGKVSGREDKNTLSTSSSTQPRGCTGVIGILDCDEGGERIVFNDINRSRVDAVRMVANQYNPLQPYAKIGDYVPKVFTDPTAGILYLFDGGDVLHGVSAVKKGVRIAAVFLYQEDCPPDQTRDGDKSSAYFYEPDKADTDTDTDTEIEKVVTLPPPPVTCSTTVTKDTT